MRRLLLRPPKRVVRTFGFGWSAYSAEQPLLNWFGDPLKYLKHQKSQRKNDVPKPSIVIVVVEGQIAESRERILFV